MSSKINPGILSKCKNLARGWLAATLPVEELGTSGRIIFKDSKPFSKTPPAGLQETIAGKMRWYGGRDQTAYLYCITETPCLIHPGSGWAIRSRSVLKESVAFGTDHQVPLPRKLEFLFPKRIQNIEEAASVMFGWENYWHFTNETIGQLALLRDQGFPDDLPVIVPSHVRELPYVKQILNELGWPKMERFHYLDGATYLKVGKLWFGKSMTHEYLQEVRDGMIKRRRPVVSTRKVIIYRKGARRFSNENEIRERLGPLGFEFVDTADLTVDQQVGLFRESMLVVGIHGAGLTNILYSERGFKLIEIFPHSMIPPHFFWTCGKLGFHYDAMVAPLQTDGSVLPDVDQLLALIGNS